MLADHQASTAAQELVLKCQKGDASAFRQIYRQYEQRVRATMYQLCGQQMLDDLVQEVFFRVWRGLPKLRQPAQFSTWLYRIAWNVATDARRQMAKRQWEKSLTPGEEEEQPWLSVPSSDQDTPDLMRLHYQELVQKGLQSLNLEQRAVLVLHDLEDLPQKEIGKILHIPLGTVKSRLYYARHTIRQFLQREGVI